MTGDSFLRDMLRLAKKDILIELRRAHELLSVLAFALSSILISSFAWRGVLTVEPEIVSATIWIVIYFSSILILTTSFAREVDRGTFEGLRGLPCPAHSILAGKILYGGSILLIVLISTIGFSIIFMNIDMGIVLPILIVFFVGVCNLALAGSIVSAIVMYSEGKTLLLSFLFFPVSIPILIPGTQGVGKIISGSNLLDVLPEIKLLIAYFLAVFSISIFLFGYIFEE